MPTEDPSAEITLLAALIRPDVVSRGLKVAAIIGTLLVAINQGNVLLVGNIPPDVFWKIPLTYLVPYLVSTYSAAQAIVARTGD